MRIHFLQHISFEDTGCIKGWADSSGHLLSGTHMYAGEDLPSHESFDLLVVMGGTMNIYEEDEHPFLSVEKEFIKKAIDMEKKVIGICLGAQLIASVLGAEVVKNDESEIGWFEVEKTGDALNIPLCTLMPDKFRAFQWHGDTFQIPGGAVHIFKSKGCKNQAFIYGDRILGLQFHPEVMLENAKNLVENCPEDTEQEGRYVASVPGILDTSHIKSANEVMYAILDYFEII